MKIISQHIDDIHSSMAYFRGKVAFTSMRSVDKRWLFIDQHLQRLWQGAIFLFPEIATRFNQEQFAELVKAKIKNDVDADANYLRLCVCEDHLLVMAKAHPETSDKINLTDAMTRKTPTPKPAYLKSPDYFIAELELRQAKASGFEEVLFYDSEDRLCEASTSNVLLVTKQAEVVAVPPSSTSLDGVMQRMVLNALQGQGWKVVERPISRIELLKAREIWLTNSIQGMRFVNRWLDRFYLIENSFFLKAQNLCGRFGEKI